MEEPLQKSLERYDVLDRIAVGGMAEVFLAKAYGAHGFEKTLAIKRILPELARDPEFAARFIAEAKVAVRLSHANVVQVFDFGRIGESLFIAMEYVDGLDLAAMLRKFKDEGRLVPLPAAFHIAIEIIRALDFAHGHNVVHRDVSPSNILVSRAGEVKIADFGIAVAAQPHRGGGPGPKRVMGKWRYMSPEQARGDTLDTRSDLFSAASVIYELFTHEKLFPGDEAEEIIKNINEMVIPRMSALRPGLPSRLDDVLASALSRKPIDRPTRPATVLRSLIELSYESSIMATALDVAEALATVIPAARISGRGALDDVIRKQLADQSVARRTAVTDGKPPSTETAERGDVSTGLFRKLDMDGLAHLEEAEVDNTKVAAPRARRISEGGVATPGDTDLHKLYDASQDKDRHTEVGGPPAATAPVPKVEPTAEPATPVAPPPSRRNLILAIGALVVIGGGITIWAMKTPATTIAIADAAVLPSVDAAVTGSIAIVSVPPGAHGTFGDIKFDTTPVTLTGPVGKKLTLTVMLTGYRTVVDENIQLDPTVKLQIPVHLVAAPAMLNVITDPPGAQATLNHQLLPGETPFAREVPVGTNVELKLTKAGFDPFTVKIDLAAGVTHEVIQQLKATQKFGYVKIKVNGSAIWAQVWFKGKKLGDSEKFQGGHGPIAYRFPVGRQELQLVPPSPHKPIKLVVDVTEGTKQYSAHVGD